MRILLFAGILFLLAASGGFLRSQAEGPVAPVAPEQAKPVAAPRNPAQFTFAVAGDHGANEATEASLAALDASGASFYLSLGDNDYDQVGPDAEWCQFVLDRLPTLGRSFPFQLVSGNHEEDDGPNGNILDHAACLPDRMGSTGTYAAEYYFDYPADAPLMRVIMIAPDLEIGGEHYGYAQGTDHYDWLAQTIDEARSAGIPWVTVGMHKNCITTGNKSCEIGMALMNLLVSRRVDLVFQGHDHNYQRSKQLAHGAGCRVVATGVSDFDCVADDGSDDAYLRGAGTVIVISGAFGRCCYDVDSDDAEAGYFAAIDDTSNGFTRLSVNAERIRAEFVPSTGDFHDAFVVQ